MAQGGRKGRTAARPGVGRRRAAKASRRSKGPTRTLKRIGIVDTSFARYDMASAAIDELRKRGGRITIHRYTVPGIKDLAAGARILFDRGCDLVMALGMVGRQPVDKDCALAADFGLQIVQAQTGRHILGVMVHEDEASDEGQLGWLFDRRTREHAANAYDLLFRPGAIRARAGTGQREGFEDAGPIRVRPS
jgi:riboflavin synthase